MIAPSVHEKISVQPDQSETPFIAAIPEFRKLVSVAAYVNAPLVAVALLFGRLNWAFGFLGGMVISLAVAGLLHVIMTRILPIIAAGQHGASAAQTKSGALMQFGMVVIAKFLVLGVVGFLILGTHAVNLIAVVAGFLLTQGSVVITTARKLHQK